MASNPRFVAIKSNGHSTATSVASSAPSAVQSPSAAPPGSISVQLAAAGSGGGPDPFDDEDLERHMLLDAAETLINLQSVQEQQQHPELDTSPGPAAPANVIYLAADPTLASTAANAIPPPVLHQLTTAAYMEEKSPTHQLVNHHHQAQLQQLELRGETVTNSEEQLDLKPPPGLQTSYDLSVPSSGSSGGRLSSMGPPPAPPPTNRMQIMKPPLAPPLIPARRGRGGRGAGSGR